MITLISSILAFVAGFVVFIFCLVYCSDEGWQNFKNAVDKARRK